MPKPICVSRCKITTFPWTRKGMGQKAIYSKKIWLMFHFGNSSIGKENFSPSVRWGWRKRWLWGKWCEFNRSVMVFRRQKRPTTQSPPTFEPFLSNSFASIETISSNTEPLLFFPLPVFLIPVIGLFRNSHFQNTHIYKRLNVPFTIDRLICHANSF